MFVKKQNISNKKVIIKQIEDLKIREADSMKLKSIDLNIVYKIMEITNKVATSKQNTFLGLNTALKIISIEDSTQETQKSNIYIKVVSLKSKSKKGSSSNLPTVWIFIEFDITLIIKVVTVAIIDNIVILNSMFIFKLSLSFVSK